MHIHYASSPNKIVEFRRTILSATPSKTTATEAWYIKVKALRALAQWDEWIVARELAHLKHIRSPHIATVGCQAFAKTKKTAVSPKRDKPLQEWRWRGSNPRPNKEPQSFLHA